MRARKWTVCYFGSSLTRSLAKIFTLNGMAEAANAILPAQNESFSEGTFIDNFRFHFNFYN